MVEAGEDGQSVGEFDFAQGGVFHLELPVARSGRAAGILREVPGMDANALAAEIRAR